MAEQDVIGELQKIVPRETFCRLQSYVDLIIEWQQRFNIVSRGTISQIWHRHIYDSFQLKNIINCLDARITDIGSGAGLPGIVLSIVGYHVNLVESNYKKVQFLSNVIDQLDLSAQVIHDRIENTILKKTDYFTSRAVASLDQLLAWVKPSLTKTSVCLFMKGERYQDEINKAQQKWFFDYQLQPSLTHKYSMILIIKNVRRKS